MLRQFQEEVNLLKAQLEAKRRGMSLEDFMSSGAGAAMMAGREAPEYEENIVEKIVYKDSGFSEADLKEKENRSKAELAEFESRNAKENMTVQEASRKAEDDAKKAEELLAAKELAEIKALAELDELEKKLAEKQDQIQVGQLAREEAIKQKAELKKTEAELAKQEEEQKRLKLELMEKEEQELYMTDYCTSFDEQMQKTTKKLKALHTKYGERKQETKDLVEEFELEMEDYVDTIRQLGRTLKLKQLVLDQFAPPRLVV